jgi:hypothetical protein
MYATRYIIAAKSMEKFHTDKKQFVNFYHIALWDTIYNTVLSTLVFISTLKFLGIFGYIKLIGRLIRIIKHCMKDLFWFDRQQNENDRQTERKHVNFAHYWVCLFNVCKHAFAKNT